MDSHFIDQSRRSLDICSIETAHRAQTAPWEPMASAIPPTCMLAWRGAVSRRRRAPVVADLVL